MKNNLAFQYIIFATVFLIPFYFFRFKILGIPTNIFEVAVLVGAISVLGKRQYHIGWWPWLLSGIALITAIFSPDPRIALGIFKGWFFIPTLFAWAIVQVFDAKNYSRLRLPLLASASIVSIWAILQKVGIVTMLFYQVGDASFSAYLSEGRAFGPFESPNYLAMYLVPVFFVVLPLVWSKVKLWKKILITSGMALMLLAISFSLSRGGGVALGAGLIVYLLAISWLKKSKPSALKYLAAAALTLIIALNIAYYVLAPRMQSPAGGDAIRQEILDYSLQLARQNPLLGVGLGNFQETVRQASTDHASFQTYALPFALHPHNLLLAFYLNLGLAGLVVFLIVTYRILNNLAKHPEAATLAAALTAVLVHGLFDTTYFKNDLSALFWLIFALSLILSQYDRKKSQNHTSRV